MLQLQKQDRSQSIAEVIFTPSYDSSVALGETALQMLHVGQCAPPALYTVQYSTVPVWRSAVSFFSKKEQVYTRCNLLGIDACFDNKTFRLPSRGCQYHSLCSPGKFDQPLTPTMTIPTSAEINHPPPPYIIMASPLVCQFH